MIVTCENCNTDFELDDDLVSESGSEVKCSKCDHAFTVYRPASVEDPGGGSEEQPDQVLDLGLPDDEESDEVLDLGLPDDEESDQVLDLGLPDEGEEPAEAELDLGAFGLEEEPPGEGPAKAAQEELDLDALSRALEEEIDDAEHPEEDRDEVLDFDLLDTEEKPAEAELDLETIGIQKDPVAEEFGGRMEEPQEPIPEPPAEEELAVPPLEAEEAPAEELPDDISAAGLAETELDEVPGVKEAAEEFKQEATPPPAPRKPAPRKGISTPVWIVVVIGLLAGGAYGAYAILKSLDIKIPFMESLMGVEETTVVDPGNLHIALPDKDISSRFVENKKAGRLFVIQGRVRNQYETARNFIVVKTVLFGKKGKELDNKTTYCGNILSEQDLVSLDKAALDKRLSNKFGHERSNFRIPPGKAIPFVVVFTDVPKGLGEFAVEVVSSLPGE